MNLALLVILLCAIAAVGGMVLWHGAVSSPAAGAYGVENGGHEDVVQSDFVYQEMPYDINPGKEYVVYTNYACPHCAEFYFGTHVEGIEYTSRILLLEDAEGVFSTQELVSAYMLKLYRDDKAAYAALEAELFGSQVDWTVLDESDLVVWLNEHSGRRWVRDDLESELEDIVQIEHDAPTDLEYVPSVFRDGERCDGLMYEMLEQGAEILASSGEEASNEV